MIDAETRLEARHALSLIEWRIVPRVRGSEESAEAIVLKGFGPDQHKEHFGADKAPFQLKEEQFEPLSISHHANRLDPGAVRLRTRSGRAGI